MKHELKKIYKENISYIHPLSIWKVECTCGWKEGDMGKSAAQARFDEHQKMWEKIKETEVPWRQGFLAGYGPEQGKDIEFQGEKFFDVDLLEALRNSIRQGD